MKIRSNLQYLKYRLNLRKTLQNESIELLYITKEELEREINIRHERAKKKKQRKSNR